MNRFKSKGKNDRSRQLDILQKGRGQKGRRRGGQNCGCERYVLTRAPRQTHFSQGHHAATFSGTSRSGGWDFQPAPSMGSIPGGRQRPPVSLGARGPQGQVDVSHSDLGTQANCPVQPRASPSWTVQRGLWGEAGAKAGGALKPGEADAGQSKGPGMPGLMSFLCPVGYSQPFPPLSSPPDL